MLRFLVLAALVVCLNGLKISDPNCGKRPLVRDSRIVNGTVAIPGDFGWSVSLFRTSHFCGGILIGKRWVISAAHCFSSTAVTSVQAVHDRSKPESWSQTVKTEKIFVHENYNSNSITNDISLLRLAEDMKFNDYVVPACIAETPDEYKKGATSFNDLFVNEPAYLSGWGHDKFGGTVQTVKFYTRLDAQTDAWCKNSYGSRFFVDSMVCAGSTTSLTGACQGDSGGPWVTQSPDNGLWYNWGQTSWGYGCGQGTVFGRTSNYIDWIKSKMALYPEDNNEVGSQ